MDDDNVELVDLTKLSFKEKWKYFKIKMRFKCYPLRKWFRWTRIGKAYQWINEWLWPRQAWLKIPRHWIDKDTLIVHVVFESIIHLVEKEREFEFADGDSPWPFDEPNPWKEACDFIRECYEFAKNERPKIQAEIDRIIHEGAEGFNIEKLNQISGWQSYDEKYPNLRNLEKELEEKETKYLTGIVKFRSFLWT